MNLVNQTLGSNSTATFYCEYNSIIPTTVTWYKDGKILLLNVNESKLVSATTNNSSTLILTNIEETDSGQYSCIVSNSIGITNSSGILTVGKRLKYLLPTTTQTSEICYYLSSESLYEEVIHFMTT